MKENQVKLLRHYQNLAKTASGMIALNAQKHADEIIGNYPGIVKALEEADKEIKKAEAKAEAGAKKNDSSA